MVRCLTESSGIVFDGMDRWAQVLRVPNASQLGGGDGYMLYAVGDTTRTGDASAWCRTSATEF